MKIFVTGGSGFIGTNFVNLALKDGHKIFNVDNLKLEFGPANLNDPCVSSRIFGSGALRRSGSR